MGDVGGLDTSGLKGGWGYMFKSNAEQLELGVVTVVEG